MTIIQVKTHKLYIIKKRSNNKVSFVEFIFNSRQFKLMTTGSQLHGARWSRFNCIQMIETMSLAAAVAKKMIVSYCIILLLWRSPVLSAPRCGLIIHFLLVIHVALLL